MLEEGNMVLSWQPGKRVESNASSAAAPSPDPYNFSPSTLFMLLLLTCICTTAHLLLPGGPQI